MSFKQSKKWTIHNKHDQSKIQKLSEELNRSPFFITLCLNRGLSTAEEITRFISPDDSWFHDPFLMHDMQKAVDRISSAVELGEKIMVYGDYDADGVTSTAILYETLEAIGANVEYFIPDRFVDGYGPNIKAFNYFKENGTQLIITVDNGVAGNEAINAIQEKGIDVIVTDHHELPDILPNAVAIVHPNHPEGEYPFSDLSGAGVALKLATALLGDLPAELLDLAAIGTIADLVSLTDENRAIVNFGLKTLKQTQRVGLISLFSALSLSLKEIDETTIGFKVAPPINAIGRLGDATPVVELLTTFDEEVAQEIAHLLDEKNKERKEIVMQITQEAMDLLKQQNEASVYVLAKEGWHEGVLGIVASRIVNETGKPAVVLNINPSTQEAKGSARSIKAFNLYESCNHNRDLFKHFGGHHMAAGMTLPVENIMPLKEALNETADQVQQSTDFVDELMIEEEVTVEQVDLKAIKEIELLKPFGTNNPKPVFLFSEVTPIEARAIGADRTHLKLKIDQNGSPLDIIAFNYGAMAEALKSVTPISVVGTIEINEWNGNKKPQMQLTDMKFLNQVVIDKRTTELKKSDLLLEGVTYIFYDEKNYEKYRPFVSEMSDSQHIDTIADAKAFKATRPYVLVDCPNSLEMIQSTLQQSDDQTVYCIFYTKSKDYLLGMPTRDQFAKVYKFLAKHKKINLKEKGSLLADYLKIDKTILKFIIKVFLEAGFVTIDSGLLSVNAEANKMTIEETAVYKQRLENIAVEETVVYSSFKELTHTLKNLV
ncbi:single-stranded-DNA-specific exonuclease RecJ [Marinilactibacillus kalidii]|uniref:single-stranded-DNA-specific exonuclease RecJ n=1 Tax=Marinilactibacillus kalidii TaxID=2820274 RepID=UPI001ABEDC5F|nr:single-stranded-DNA-specific exonuclease RecJ [Marinilactibacillus kalidii]